MTYFDLSDPTFDVTSPTVHAAREDDWYVETNWGWAILRHAEVSAVLAGLDDGPIPMPYVTHAFRTNRP